LAKLSRFLAPRRPLACRVDCVYYDSSSVKRGEAQRPIQQLRNPDGSALWRRDKADAAPAAQHRPSYVGEVVREYAEPTKEMPFRLKEVVPVRSRWRCRLTQAHLVEEEDVRTPLFDIGAWSTERRFAHPRLWLIKREEPGLGCGPTDTFQDEAVDMLLGRRGGVVVGRGGTGKSEILRRLVARLKERGVEAHVVAFTHVAAQNAEGGTILHELYANKHQKKVALCVDEASMVSLRMWAQLAKLHFTCAMVFVFGDWAGQLMPIADQGREERHRVEQLHARPLQRLPHRAEKFRRGGDRAHFDLVGGMCPSLCTLDVALPRAREKYPAQAGRWARCS
jgi:hypothetical protein